MDEYLQSIKAIVDVLALAQLPISDDDLVIQSLNGLNSKFHGIATAMRARDTEIIYEEVFGKLVDYDNVLKQYEVVNVTPMSVNTIQKGVVITKIKVTKSRTIAVEMEEATRVTTLALTMLETTKTKKKVE